MIFSFLNKLGDPNRATVVIEYIGENQFKSDLNSNKLSAFNILL